MAILGLELQTSEFMLSRNPAEQEVKVLGLCPHTNRQREREGDCSDNSEYNKFKKRFAVRKLVFLD